MSPGTSSVRDREDLARKSDRTRKRPRLLQAWRWLRDRLARAAGRVRDRARASVRLIRAAVSRAADRLRNEIRSRARQIKSLILATVGEDRGFGFWWLVITVAIALIIGLLVAVLLSPVIGLLAALIAGIWMLVRGGRSAESRRSAKAAPAS